MSSVLVPPQPLPAAAVVVFDVNDQVIVSAIARSRGRLPPTPSYATRMKLPGFVRVSAAMGAIRTMRTMGRNVPKSRTDGGAMA